jgi:hypothetical protein
VGFQVCVQLIEHDPGLHARIAFGKIHFQNLAKVSRYIHDDAVAQGLPIRAGAPAARTYLDGTKARFVSEAE